MNKREHVYYPFIFITFDFYWKFNRKRIRFTIFLRFMAKKSNSLSCMGETRFYHFFSFQSCFQCFWKMSSLWKLMLIMTFKHERLFDIVISSSVLKKHFFLYLLYNLRLTKSLPRLLNYFLQSKRNDEWINICKNDWSLNQKWIPIQLGNTCIV